MSNSIALNLTLISFSFFNYGSMSWKPGWLQFEKPSMQGDVSLFLEKANQLLQSADTKEKVLELIGIYKQALKTEPNNQEALSGAAQYNALIAMGYSGNKEEKKVYFFKTIKFCEQIMYLNQAVKNLVDKGEPLWEACRALSVNELDALFFYYLGTAGCWKDCLSGFEKLINIKWTARGKKLFAAMMTIDPEWACGVPYYSWANFYAAAPRFAGGDMNKASEYYQKAIELGPEMLNFRRTRALFFHLKNKDRKSFQEDLEWVVAQNPARETKHLTYPWKAFLQRECRHMLDHIDDYF